MSADAARASDVMGIQALTPLADGARHHTEFRVERWDQEQVDWVLPRVSRAPRMIDFYALRVLPYADDVYHGNLVTTAGWGLILQSGNLYNSSVSGGVGGGTGVSTPLFSNTVGRIGVGSGTIAASYADTQLTTALLYKFCGAAPSITVTNSARSLTFTAVFGTADATGSWQEFGIDKGTADSTVVTAPMINHGVQAMGSKAAGQVWNATATINFS